MLLFYSIHILLRVLHLSYASFLNWLIHLILYLIHSLDSLYLVAYFFRMSNFFFFFDSLFVTGFILFYRMHRTVLSDSLSILT
jgi:hypothetical protein